MVSLVERMLELNKRRGGLGPPAARKQTGGRRPPLPATGDEDDLSRLVGIAAADLERAIASTDAKIDTLV